MRLVAGSSAITLKLSSRMRYSRVFKGLYVSTKGILLIFSSVELLLERANVRLLRFWHFHTILNFFFYASLIHD